MTRFDTPDNNQPLMWVGGQAIHAPHAIVAGYVVTMLFTTVCQFAQIDAPFIWLPYSSEAVLKGEVWRILSYGLANPPSLWFVIDMFMIVWFGRELEKFFGRRTFLRFYGCLYLLTPLLFTLVGLWLPMRLSGVTGAFALFIAFATLYPSAAFFLNLQAKWLAAILVAIYTLMALSNRDLPGLISLWASVGFAHGFVRYEQGRLILPKIDFWSRKPKLRVLPDLPPDKPVREQKVQSKSMAEIDTILDKIARSGMASLTAKERARLEQSRAELLKQRGPRGS